MNNWYLSNHGDVSGPFPLTEAQAFLKKENSKTAQFYAWHANFIQWQPAYALAEFETIVEAPLENVPATDQLHEKFVKKQQLLGERLEHVEGRVLQARDNLLAFEDDIIAYKGLTEGFSDEIKNAIIAVEKKYRSISKKLEGIESATEIAQNEISNVRDEFYAKDESTEVNNKTEAAEEKVVETPQKEVKKAIEKASAAVNAATSNKAESVKQEQSKSATKKAVGKQPEEVKPENASVDNKAAKTEGNAPVAGLKGVKNMFKSVFKEPSTGPKLSEALNASPEEATAKQPKEEELEVVKVDETVEDDDAPKKRRRRRRR